MPARSLLNPKPAELALPDGAGLRMQTSHGHVLICAEQCGAREYISARTPVSPAYLVQLRLQDCDWTQHSQDGRTATREDGNTDSIQFYDLRRAQPPYVHTCFHALHLIVPLVALHAVSKELGQQRCNALITAPGQWYRDLVIENLLLSLMPQLHGKQEQCALLNEKIATALCVRLVDKYAQSTRALPHQNGGLAPWQLRLAQEYLAAQLHQTITLDTAARLCRLSLRHFSRAFQHSTGLSPYQYRLVARVEQAKALLAQSRCEISKIAAHCGFASASHFSRTFHAKVGCSPATWRKGFGAAPTTYAAPNSDMSQKGRSLQNSAVF